MPAGLDFRGGTFRGEFLQQDLRGANFDGATLVGVVLTGDLTGATFRGARINGFFNADLTDANFEDAIFVNGGSAVSELRGKLDGACFIGAVFQNIADFPAVVFEVLALIGVDFSYTNVDKANIGDALGQSDSRGNRFRGLKLPCDLLDARYLGAIDLATADLSGCRTALKGRDLSSASFAGADLRNFDFAGARLAGAVFDGATFGPLQDGGDFDTPFDGTVDVEKASFKGAHFDSVRFHDADLRGADFTGATLGNTQFSGTTRLQAARFDGATLRSTGFVGVDVSGATFKGSTLDFPSFLGCTTSPATDFSGATLTGSGSAGSPHFYGTDMSGVVFDGATFRSMNLGATVMKNASFRRATIDAGTVFFITGGDGTEIRGASMDGVHFEQLKAPNVGFVGSSFRGAHFDGAALTGTQWNQSTLDGASFQNATLDRATGFNGPATRLSGIVFNLASARGVDFSNARLYSADFSGADLEAADFTGASLIADPANPFAVAAKFDNAHLQNVSFARATLNSVSFRSASLYSSVPAATCTLATATCTADAPRTGGTCSCATLSGANLTATIFDRAFLYRVDLSTASTIVNGTSFGGAILVDANFNLATFAIDPAQGGKAPSFNNAWLQGADLGTADFNGSSLSGAFVDFGARNAEGGFRAGNFLYMRLSRDYASFRNWSGSSTPCLKLEQTKASVLPNAIVNAECPSGEKASPVDGCGPQRPFAPGVAPNPRWFGGSVIAGTPVASYEKQSTYEPPTTPVCTRGADDQQWFKSHITQ